MKPPILRPIESAIENLKDLPSGRYLVVREDGKTHFETFNGSGWAYNHKVIKYFYIPE